MQNLRVIKQTCRHGTLSFYADDEYVGRSLLNYGDFSEDEVSVFQKLLKPDHVAVEVGSNIGALTVPMARLCKKVFAFEPQPQNAALLRQNIEDNDLASKVSVWANPLGAECRLTWMPSFEDLEHHNYGAVEIGHGSLPVEMLTLDWCLPEDQAVQFIKIDAEGSELEILKGAAKTIEANRPFLYVENDRKEKSAALTGWLIDHGYRCYWHKVPLFYEGNWKAEQTNVFARIVSQNMICIPEEIRHSVERLEEVLDHRVDDQMYVREKTRALHRVEDNPDDLDARAMAAHFCNLDGDRKTALALLAENFARVPDHGTSIGIQALLDLQGGNYKRGWQGYEMRYAQLDPKTFGWRPHSVPHWDGTPTDKTVLIWAEQGWGDSIMFGRFMREVLKVAPNAILEIQPQLFELFELSRIVPEDRLFRLGRALPEYHLHCALPSVPAVLRFDNEQQLVRDKYLFADPAMVDGWKKRSTPKIGICLRGGTTSERAYSRDMPEQFGDFLARRIGPMMTLTHEGQWESYADTAAAIEALDLVLTVDTSLAHLAGALGARTFLMLSTDPDWRWQHQRRDTPFYPSMTIFRQKKLMDWSNVVDEVLSELGLQGR